MGLVKSERKEKQIKLSRTDLGEIIYMEDPGLQELLTKTLLHAMLLRSGKWCSICGVTFLIAFFQSIRNGIKKELLDN